MKNITNQVMGSFLGDKLVIRDAVNWPPVELQPSRFGSSVSSRTSTKKNLEKSRNNTICITDDLYFLLTNHPEICDVRLRYVRRRPRLHDDRPDALDEEGLDLGGGDLVDPALAGGGHLGVVGVLNPEREKEQT